jgi:hypothetical protein
MVQIHCRGFIEFLGGINFYKMIIFVLIACLKMHIFPQHMQHKFFYYSFVSIETIFRDSHLSSWTYTLLNQNIGHTQFMYEIVNDLINLATCTFPNFVQFPRVFSFHGFSSHIIFIQMHQIANDVIPVYIA